jgi:hypothetical protein
MPAPTMDSPLDRKEEGSGRIGNEAVIQIERFLLVILGRRGKAGLARQYFPL